MNSILGQHKFMIPDNSRRSGWRWLAMGNSGSAAKAVLRLELVRGSSSTVPDDGAVMMEAGIWGTMPEEVIWEVLRFVPASKLFQWQLVSRKWRQELASAHFLRKRLATAAADEREHVIACVWRWVRSDSAAGGGSSSRSDVNKVLELDLAPMVPRGFCHSWWWWSPYCVEAAAHGLVCIGYSVLEQVGKKSRTSRLCVLNLLTRTSVKLPQLPFPVERWHLPTSAAGAVTILGWSGTAWVLATYHLAAAGGQSREWVVADESGGGVPNWVPAKERKPPVYALLGVESYWYDGASKRVRILAPGPGGAGGGHCQVEVGALNAPSLTRDYMYYSRLDWCTTRVLLAHPVRGAIFFVCDLTRRVDRKHAILTGRYNVSTACLVWRLVRQRMEWEVVALLDMAELERLTGASHAPGHGCIRLHDAYAVRNLVCCTVSACVKDSAGSTVFRKWLLGFNLDSGKWELLIHNRHDLEVPVVAMDLRPEVFLSAGIA